MSIDYNALAEQYDLSRSANMDIVNRFAAELALDGKKILDFGCGTGNFAFALGKMTTAAVYGVEPSDGMREKAVAKGVDARKGDHTGIPFADGFFDFVYMTDVIHHVPDVNAMFTEFMRVLKPGGLVCILTESHEQLATRFWTHYFPTTVAVERSRYPDIPEIIHAAEAAGLCVHKTVTTDAQSAAPITEDFVRLVEEKGFSMFRLLAEQDYVAGLAALKADFEKQITLTSTHGETLLWLKKDSGIAYTDRISVEDYNMLHEAVGWGTCKPERIHMALERSDFITVAVAQADGKTVGMARVMHDGLQALVMDVIVQPAFQGQGIGKTMMTKVMAYLHTLSVTGGIKVSLISAKDRVSFYEQFGFIERPTATAGPGMTQWICNTNSISYQSAL